MPKTYLKVCDRAECGQPFQTKHKEQTFCCKSCAAYTRRGNQGFPAWRKEEIILLEQLSGACPFPEIVRKLQELACCHGWQPRTTAAIKSYMCAHGYEMKCTLDNFTGAELARILGVSYQRINCWKRYGKLPYYNVSKTQSVIQLKALKRWARTNPHYLAGIDREHLSWLFDEALVNLICQSSSSAMGIPIAVKRVDTKQVYPSLQVAAQQNHMDPTTLAKAIRKGRRFAGGIEWEVV